MYIRMKNDCGFTSLTLFGRWDRNGGSLPGTRSPLQRSVTGCYRPLTVEFLPNENQLKWLARCISASGTPEVVGYRSIYRTDLCSRGFDVPSAKNIRF